MQRKKGFIRRCTALLVVLCLMVAMLPQTAFATGTDTGKAIRFGTSNISGAQADNIYFGTYRQSSNGSGGYNTDPIKWRVLSNSGGKLFLLSDQNLDVQEYHNEYTEYIKWENCSLRTWLNDIFLNAAFSTDEQAKIAMTDVVNNGNPDYNISGGSNTQDKIFLLSIDEATGTNYGFATDNPENIYDSTDTRVSTNTAYVAGHYEMGSAGEAECWWLRSPGYYDYNAVFVDTVGFVPDFGDAVYSPYYTVRPAFNLNLNSVLFTSAAVGGKADDTVDSNLTSVADYTGNEWKLTFLDSNRNFSVTQTALTAAVNGTATFNYSGAQTGSNEYVSAMIVDGSGSVLYYGRVAQGSASGTANITIPGDLTPGSYTLKVFSEQYNGDKMTDYASEFKDISLTVTADTTAPAIQLGASNISGYDSTNGYDYIYYGTWSNSPIKWRVLSMNGNSGTYSDETSTVDASNAMFLLSDVLLGTGEYGGVYFNSTGLSGNAWQGSDAQAWCSTFYSNNLTTQEQGAVLATTKSDKAFTGSTYSDPYAASNNILNGDKVFFLSAEEAHTGDYGFGSDNDRKANYGSSSGGWWLRSPLADHLLRAGFVDPIGNVYGFDVFNSAWAARPAFNLDMNSVLFTSAAEGGKSASGMDSGLTAVDGYNGNEWKLTLLDSSRESFTVSNATTNSSGDTIAFSYSGAQTGTNEYISVIIEDNGAITHYGRILQLDGTTNRENGAASLTLPAGVTLSDTTKLYVFNEQYNGDKMTDYASPYMNIPLTVEDNTAPTLSEGTVTRGEGTATVTFTSNEAGSYYYAVVDSGADEPTIDTTGEGTSCDTSEQTITLSGIIGSKDIYIVVKDAVNNVSDMLKMNIPLIGLSAPENLVWDGSNVSWDSVDKASKYLVSLYKDGAQEPSVTGETTQTSYSFIISEPGSYTFTVTAIGDGSNYSDSQPVQSTALHTVSFDSNGGGDIAMQLIKDGEKVQEPAAPEILGLTLEGWYNGSSKWTFESDAVTASMKLTAQYNNTPKYTVTIPESVTLGDNAIVSASGVNVASGWQLEVALTATSGTNNAFTLESDEKALISYTVQNSSGGTIAINDTVLTVAGGIANNSGSETLSFLPPDITYYSGSYTGTVTFTVRVS